MFKSPSCSRRLVRGLVLGVAFIFLSRSAAPANAQTAASSPKHALSLWVFGISTHPDPGPGKEVYSRKLSSDGATVVNPGLAVAYDRFLIGDRLAARVSISGASDCRSVFAGLAHLGLKIRLLQLGRASLGASVGPMLYVRQSWHRFDNYSGANTAFQTWDQWQYIAAPVGGSLEFNYRISDRTELSMSVLPAYPEVISAGFGFRFHR